MSSSCFYNYEKGKVNLDYNEDLSSLEEFKKYTVTYEGKKVVLDIESPDKIETEKYNILKVTESAEETEKYSIVDYNTQKLSRLNYFSQTISIITSYLADFAYYPSEDRIETLPLFKLIEFKLIENINNILEQINNTEKTDKNLITHPELITKMTVKIKRELSKNMEVLYAISYSHDEFIIVYDQQSKILYISFRGTTSSSDYRTDLRMWNSRTRNTQLHSGVYNEFMKDLQFIIFFLINKIIDDKKEFNDIIITGHSLGAGYAELCAFDLELVKRNMIQKITFDANKDSCYNNYIKTTTLNGGKRKKTKKNERKKKNKKKTKKKMKGGNLEKQKATHVSNLKKRLVSKLKEKQIIVYTYCAITIGDYQFMNIYNYILPYTYRFLLNKDIITLNVVGRRHVGLKIYLYEEMEKKLGITESHDMYNIMRLIRKGNFDILFSNRFFKK